VTDKAKRCIDWVMRREGGLADDPHDRGGLTNYGISSRAHPGLDVRNLTREQAAGIYERDYWTPLGCEGREEPLALALLDFGVHSGVERATATLHTLEGAAGIALGPVDLAMEVIRRRAYLLVSIALATPGQEDFLAGWMRRIACLIEAVRAFESAAEPPTAA
jgi:lysozyme family protein